MELEEDYRFMDVRQNRNKTEEDREQAIKRLKDAEGFIVATRHGEKSGIVMGGKWAKRELVIAGNKIRNGVLDLVEELEDEYTD